MSQKHGKTQNLLPLHIIQSKHKTMSKKTQNQNNAKISVLSASNTADVGRYQKGVESRSEIDKSREKERILSPIIYDRFADFILLFLGAYSRFGKLVRTVGCGDLFVLFNVWLHIYAAGAAGVTVNGLVKALELVNSDTVVPTLKYRLGVLRSRGLVSLVGRGRYSYYVITRHAEKNILDFEIAKSDIVSFVASFRRVMKEHGVK